MIKQKRAQILDIGCILSHKGTFRIKYQMFDESVGVFRGQRAPSSFSFSHPYSVQAPYSTCIGDFRHGLFIRDISLVFGSLKDKPCTWLLNRYFIFTFKKIYI